MRKRIMICIPTIGSGGIERVVYHLARNLSSQFDVIILGQTNQTASILYDIISDKIKILPSPKNAKFLKHFYILLQVYKVYSAIIRIRPHVLISAHPRIHLTVGIAFSLLPKTLKPRWIVTEHGNPELYLGTHPQRIQIKRFLLKRFVRNVNSFIAVSHYVANLAENLYSNSKFRVIYNPVVDENIFRLAEQKVEHPWFDTHLLVIISAGRLTQNKGFATLLQSFKIVNEQRQETRLIILGDGELMHNLVNIANQLGISDRVWFAGFVDNPFKYFAHSTIFAFPSKSEGQPLAVIEAMALGLPVVSTKILSIEEFIKYGINGILVPVDDADKMADAIISMIDNPNLRRQIGYMAAKSAKELFLTEESTKKYYNMIKEIGSL